jgi:hypothetical protein
MPNFVNFRLLPGNTLSRWLAIVALGGKSNLYSPNCREEVFSETGLLG